MLSLLCSGDASLLSVSLGYGSRMEMVWIS